MLQIRSKVFETNSSMTHCCVITTEDEFKKWAEGKVLFCQDKEHFMDADLAFEENVKELESWLNKSYCAIKKEDVERYKNKEIPLIDLFPKYKSDMRDFYLTSEEWDAMLEDAENDEYWEKRETIATNPPVTVVAFGYLGADY